MTKSRIVDELGEQDLLLPTQVNEALAANDRAKYLMSLLQLAREHADNPEVPTSDLRQERVACGVTDSELDSVVAGSRRESTEHYSIPAAQRVHQNLVADVGQMLTPVRTVSASVSPNMRGNCAVYDDRLNQLLSRTPASLTEDKISGEYLSQLTSGQREAGDSLHLLVMDLHKELNRIQQQLTTETIGGASVYRITDDDRPLIAAFMAGVNQTRELKFDHPGLGTTATRSGERLVIQNDIGMTDAHVLVIHVTGTEVTLTYSDVHIVRLVFFQSMFSRYAVSWQDTVSKRATGMSEDLYHLCLGTYTAQDHEDLKDYLTFLGSRLVFLIDWNRARKRLRRFAPRRICLEVLRWAADQNYGHRGFLALGGEQLIFDALQTSGRLALPPGGQLSDVLGAERTTEFLKFTLQKATQGLQAGQSEFLIRDEISAELRHYIDTVHQGLLDVAGEHASLIVELAVAARDMLLFAGLGTDDDYVKRMISRAKKWEHRADELVSKSRTAQTRGDAPGPVFDLLVHADDIADGLEEAIFRVSLLPEDVLATMPVSLSEMASLVLQGAQEYLKAVDNARILHRGSPREQVADFLQAVDKTLTVEHQTDEAHRQAQVAIMHFTGDYKHWHVVNSIANKLEEVTDSLLRSAMVLRDYILGEVLRR
jgi:uncharacterized protein Yka (UPF0111/DUF47 family)